MPGLNCVRAKPWRDSAAQYEKPLSVWLVDDDNSLRELLRDLLQGQDGITCPHTFSTPQGALEALANQTPPDAILLDLHLGELNGLEAIGPLKRHSPSTQVLMLTTFSDSLTEARALKAGAAAYLLKSYEIGQIVATIQNACSTPRPPDYSSCESKPETEPADDRAEFTPVSRPNVTRPIRLFHSLRSLLSL